MSTENTPVRIPASNAGVKEWIASPYFADQVAKALPSLITPERFLRIAITATARTPKLLECSKESVMKCLLDCAAFGLEPDGRRAHLIPYGRECTLVMDYKGIVELVRRSGDVSSIHADVVCEADFFEHSMGKVTKHSFDLRKPRGAMYAAYAMVVLKDGTQQAAIMGKEEIEAIRKRSRAGSSGPWVTDYNEMAKKTAFRRLSKWLTLSPEVRDMIERDDDAPAEKAEIAPILDAMSQRIKKAEDQQTNDAAPPPPASNSPSADELAEMEKDMR